VKRSKPDDKVLPLMSEKVDMRPLKELVRELPTRSIFRKVIEAEPDWVPGYEFVGKLTPWFTLRKAEKASLYD
jgi:hypothetical protein